MLALLFASKLARRIVFAVETPGASFSIGRCVAGAMTGDPDKLDGAVPNRLLLDAGRRNGSSSTADCKFRCVKPASSDRCSLANSARDASAVGPAVLALRLPFETERGALTLLAALLNRLVLDVARRASSDETGGK